VFYTDLTCRFCPVSEIIATKVQNSTSQSSSIEFRITMQVANTPIYPAMCQFHFLLHDVITTICESYRLTDDIFS